MCLVIDIPDVAADNVKQQFAMIDAVVLKGANKNKSSNKEDRGNLPSNVGNRDAEGSKFPNFLYISSLSRDCLGHSTF